MPSLVSALSALAVVSFTLATPVQRANKTFTVYEDVPKPRVPGAVQLAKAYRKFGATPPRDVLAAAATGSVTAWPQASDWEYLCGVYIGDPEQLLYLEFDTGSADLWVYSTETPPDQAGQNHDLYDPTKSETAVWMRDSTWSITYADGTTASGNVYRDDVDVGGTIVVSQPLGVALEVSPKLQEDQADGILGLASSALNTIKPTSQNTFFQTAINQGVIEEPVFTADLQKGAPGSYDFGFIDTTKYIEPIAYVPVANGNGEWQIVASGYTVGGGEFQDLEIAVIPDTGTWLVFLDEDIVDDYYSEVSDATYETDDAGYVFPCSTVLPSLTFTFGNYDAVIPGPYLNACTAIEDGYCFGGLQRNDGMGGESLLGTIFLKSQFVIFDSGNSQVGFAEKTSTTAERGVAL